MRWQRVMVVALIVALSACANVQRRRADDEVTGMPASIASLKPMDIAGRISMRQGREGHSGGVRWHYDPPRHDIRVTSPLGQTVARIVESVQGVTLTTADNQSVTADDPDQLVEAVLGWRLPLKGLEHWVLGQPSPDSQAKTEFDSNQRISRMLQDSWEILYSGYRVVRGVELPGRIEMRRDNILVRLIVDDWKPVLKSP